MNDYIVVYGENKYPLSQDFFSRSNFLTNLKQVTDEKVFQLNMYEESFKMMYTGDIKIDINDIEKIEELHNGFLYFDTDFIDVFYMKIARSYINKINECRFAKIVEALKKEFFNMRKGDITIEVGEIKCYENIFSFDSEWKPFIDIILPPIKIKQIRQPVNEYLHSSWSSNIVQINSRPKPNECNIYASLDVEIIYEN